MALGLVNHLTFNSFPSFESKPQKTQAMIVYGWRSSGIKEEDRPAVKCTNCEETGGITFARFVNYFHIFWIPLFPFKTNGVGLCTKCETEFTPKRMDARLREEYERFKSGTSVPLWSFVGLALIAVLIAGITIAGVVSDQKTAAIVEAPQVGDVFHYKDIEGFSTFKVTGLLGDTLAVVSYNTYATNRKSGISEIDISSNYSDTAQWIIPFSELKAMLDEEKIIDAKR